MGMYVMLTLVVLWRLSLCNCVNSRVLRPGERMTRDLKLPPAMGHVCSGNASIPFAPVVLTETVSSPAEKDVHIPVTSRQR